jgi:hypothetical protein
MLMLGLACSFVVKLMVVTKPAVKREVLCHDLALAMTDAEVEMLASMLIRELGVGTAIPVEEFRLAVELKVMQELGV